MTEASVTIIAVVAAIMVVVRAAESRLILMPLVLVIVYNSSIQEEPSAQWQYGMESVWTKTKLHPLIWYIYCFNKVFHVGRIRYISRNFTLFKRIKVLRVIPALPTLLSTN